MYKLSCILLLTNLLFWSCKNTEDGSEKADLIVYNADLYTVDTDITGNYVAIAGGKILAVGSDNYETYKGKNTQLIDAQGNFVMPGFIEG
ncbi:MAG TPA: hypothetical protein PKD85_23560, partial [Saprospiraceae bacterium]|nr:hypothetical protein [Saprospiraceae bacterium]